MWAVHHSRTHFDLIGIQVELEWESALFLSIWKASAPALPNVCEFETTSRPLSCDACAAVRLPLAGIVSMVKVISFILPSVLPTVIATGMPGNGVAHVTLNKTPRAVKQEESKE